MHQKPLSIGVDVGATKIKCAVVDAQGAVLRLFEMKSWEHPRLEDNLELLCQYVQQLMDEFGREHIHSIGLGLPGTVDNESGQVVYTPNLRWNQLPLSGILSGRTGLPIYLIQDTGAAVWGEYLYGAGRGCSNVVCVTIGSGVGCGIIIHGRLYGGTSHTAGEIGHLHIEDDDLLCGCGNTGCLEAHASGFGLVKMFRHGIEQGATSLLTGQGAPQDIDAYSIFSAARQGDAFSQEIVDKMARYLAKGLSAMATVLAPDVLIISGGLSRETEWLLAPMEKYFFQYSYRSVRENVRLTTAALGADAPLIGASALYKAPEYNPEADQTATFR